METIRFSLIHDLFHIYIDLLCHFWNSVDFEIQTKLSILNTNANRMVDMEIRRRNLNTLKTPRIYW